jgi:hypothetical protein
MCTVSFIPVGNRFFLTSNRDEKRLRKTAAAPKLFKVGPKTLLYPKDADKGGTWIGVNENGDAAVLLNGAENPHTPQPHYTNSRGLVIPQLLSADQPLTAFEQYNTTQTEPFTLVLFTGKKLYQCRWDGHNKTTIELPATERHIWSSATLYDEATIQKRKGWFERWNAQHPQPAQEEIISFHRQGGDGDAHNDFVMNRSGEMFTVSISSVCMEEKKSSFLYHDLVNKQCYRQELRPNGSLSDAAALRRFFIRLSNWEYWPFHVVYAPIYLYWFWLCLKARSFFFFNTANPTIRNGGFLMESKKEIYDLLPEGTYPKTVLIPFNQYDVDAVQGLLQKEGLAFPLIAKPDIGLRGMAVKLLRNWDDVAAYHQQSQVDYLVQAFVPYQEEAGIFYYRMPDETDGVISGVVGKEFMVVKGDGRQTVEELLNQDDRYFLQLPALRKMYGARLSQILAAGESLQLTPYGNHSRGAKFLDRTADVSPQLYHTINELCKNIPGFYFGRLDIKYRSWKELSEGKHFSIIELNGSGSEPAHIYDPKHSIWFGWKEIMRHLHILYRISRRGKALHQLSYLTWKEGVRLLKDNSAYVEKLQ